MSQHIKPSQVIKCTKCRKQYRYDERQDFTNEAGALFIGCPSCKCEEYEIPYNAKLISKVYWLTGNNAQVEQESLIKLYYPEQIPANIDKDKLVSIHGHIVPIEDDNHFNTWLEALEETPNYDVIVISKEPMPSMEQLAQMSLLRIRIEFINSFIQRFQYAPRP